MDNSGIVKKRFIFFILFLIILGIGLLLYYLVNNQKKDDDGKIIDNSNNENTPSISVDETGIYGIFINENDVNSFFEFKENGQFKYVMNVCEGYVTYTEENYNLYKEVNIDGENSTIYIRITSKNNLEYVNIAFNSSLVSSIGTVIEYKGPYSCSLSEIYKRA